MRIHILLLLSLVSWSTAAQATTYPAASCANTAASPHVQTAINLAAAGDTVTVPAGNCTWDTTVTIASKNLTLTGAGAGRTNITDQTAGTFGALSVTGASTTNFVDISGFTFLANTAQTSGIVQLTGTQFSVAGRFHHNAINASVGRGMSAFYAYFLIDHNEITAASAVQGIAVHGGPSGGADGGFIPWQRPLTLGSANCTYIEDNTFRKTAFGSAEDIIDGYAGARICIRHNTFTNTKIGFHGTDSGGIRSPVSFEIYSNTFTNTTASAAPYGFRARGGTGVVFSNTFTASPGGWGNLQMAYHRACNVNPISHVDYWGQTGCDGTQYELGSASLSSDLSRRACDTMNGGVGNSSPSLSLGGCEFFPTLTWVAHVRFCSLDPETLCTGDASCAAAGKGICTRYLDGSGTGGYPGRDQPGVGPGQVVTPIFFWSNTGASPAAFDLGTTNNCNGFGLANYILSGRDFIDNGMTPKPGYTAYPYPHPLAVVATRPTPPTGLRIVGLPDL